MERFVVSARKYRPVTFSTVVGQPSITNTLKNAIRNNHLAQAFLFTGPRGVGKTTTARILAKTVNCENLTQEIEACDQCASCVSFNTGQNLNIFELDAASNNSVEDIRALTEQVRYAPQMGRYKIYIIDEVHMLSAAAFNAFLKTLEEPPSYAIFILATTEKHKILPTILSRCQIFDFNRIGVNDIVKHLQFIASQEGVDAEEEALHIVAQKADGALRDSLSLFDQMVSFSGNKLTYKDVITNLNILDHDYYFRVTDEILARNTSAVLLTFNEIISNGFDGHNFISGLAQHFRNLLVSKDEITLPLLEVSQNVRERFQVQARLCTAEWLLQALDIAQKTDIQYKQSKNQRLHIEFCLLKMCASVNQTTPTEPVKKKTDLPINKAPVANTTVQAAPASINIVENTTPTVSASVPSITAQPIAQPAQQTTTSTPKPAAAPITGRRTISLSSGKPSGSEKKTILVSEEVIPDKLSPFTDEQLIFAWKEFAKVAEHRGDMALHATLNKRNPQRESGEQFLFIVDNTAIESEITDTKTEMLQFIRGKISNYNFNFRTEVNIAAKGNTVPYTPSEKFAKLAEINPAMHNLRKIFDLEIEY